MGDSICYLRKCEIKAIHRLCCDIDEHLEQANFRRIGEKYKAWARWNGCKTEIVDLIVRSDVMINLYVLIPPIEENDESSSTFQHAAMQSLKNIGDASKLYKFKLLSPHINRKRVVRDIMQVGIPWFENLNSVERLNHFYDSLKHPGYFQSISYRYNMQYIEKNADHFFDPCTQSDFDTVPNYAYELLRYSKLRLRPW
ncbi:hypothetical protein JD969_02595 [Planctomycetota bacterium]|nr:hypothetical protein JD969_02595 [Planctomycetota bacterium]